MFYGIILRRKCVTHHFFLTTKYPSLLFFSLLVSPFLTLLYCYVISSGIRSPQGPSVDADNVDQFDHG